ncbi:MAG: condensation domain-containing protein [Kibdelosporangium sp.]
MRRTMTGAPIAIIGAAFRLPDADTLDRLHENLAGGHDSVRPPSPGRVTNAGGVLGTSYVPLGYLDRIDLFDHRFFGISLGEAEQMDPHQRLSLQLVHEALENACYAPGALRGSPAAVIISAPNPAYSRLYSDDDTHQILGGLPAAAAARIAYAFDFTGPAFVVDTACSGSLNAIALAVDKLRTGQADLVISGGLSVESVLHPAENHDPLLGVISEDGVCRPFDARADGTIGGEGGGFVVLKRLSDAVAAGDNVHAVLRGIAVNHNGSSATSMSAPSSRSQAAVIRAAWQDAGTGPESISYTECHGSGTPLGDVVEVDGLRQAFGDSGGCVIGAVKGNFGHLDHAAGMAGLFRLLAGLRHGTLYPAVHFESPNPLIDFQSFAVGTRLSAWEPQGGSTRLAGLSSFGLTGTNVHAVVEQAPAVARDSVPDEVRRLVTVSAKSPGALRRYGDALAEFAGSTGHSLAGVSFALNSGRDDHPYRWAFTVAGTKELGAALRQSEPPEHPVPAEVPVVLLFSGDAEIDDAAWAALCAEFGTLDETLTDCVLRQHALAELLASLGLTASHMVGSGRGNLAVQVARSRLAAAEAGRLAATTPATSDVDDAGLRRAVKGFTSSGAVLVEMSETGALSGRIAELAPDLPVVRLLGPGGVLSALGRLYELGANLDWSAHHAGSPAARIEVPTYPFEPVSCWHASAPNAAAPAPRRAVGDVTDNTDIAATLTETWVRILKADSVTAESDYFQLGGTSIAGIGLLREIEDRFGARLTFADLYEHPTLGGMAALVGQRRATSGEDWTVPVVPRHEHLPLSVNQEQLWYIEQLEPGTALYNIPTDLRYRGPLDRTALAGAFADLAERHEVMRIRMVADDNGRPRILPAPRPELRMVDLSAVPVGQREQRVRDLAAVEATTGFDLSRGPLVRGVLFALGENDHLLLCTWHHIIFDGWAPRIFFRDLGEFYAARLAGRPPKLPPLPVQYVDFAAWQRKWLTPERKERGLGYWRAQLDGARPRELPLDRPRPPVESHRGAMLEFMLRQEIATGLREFSRQEGVTTFVTMLAAIKALMHLWAGHDDVVIGAATTGRTNPATHELIGYFNNLLPFRTLLDGSLSFRDLVRRCATTVTGALDHEEIPFGDIVAALRPERDPARHPYFTVAYTHQNTATHPADLEGLTVAPADEGGFGVAPGTSKFDLTIGVSDQDGGPMRGYLEYAVDLFDEDTMRQVVELYLDIITTVLADPDRPLAQVRPEPLMVWDTIQRHATLLPQHIALVDSTGSHTYSQVVHRTRELAGQLLAAGAGPGVAVPVIAGRGVDLVVGWLAVLAVGAAFVPIDPAAPRERTDRILADIGASVKITGDEVTGVSRGADDVPPEVAYVAFTSGSTGHPQGVHIGHASLLNLLTWYGQRLHLSESDNVGQSFAAGFDGAIVEVLGALYHGSSLHFLPDVRITPAALAGWLADNGITAMSLPTPVAELLISEYTETPGLVLRVLWTGGDRLRARPSADLPFTVFNLYGPTECTVVSTAAPVAADGAELPDIGLPITGTRAYLLDSPWSAQADEGELYIGGAAVGEGYHRQPMLTATRFVADPFGPPGARMYRTGDLASRRRDGSIDFHGRADDQIAVRGFRVEPAEVERVLVAQAGVREAMVLSEQHLSGSTGLVAHVAGDAVVRPAELIAAVAGALPAHMVPGRVHVHDVLPKTTNGKLDRRSLRQETPMTQTVDVGQVLTRIFADLLGRDHVTPDDDFFKLGGDSILSVGVAARAARAGVAITPQDVLRYPTVRGLSAVAAPDQMPGTNDGGEPREVQPRQTTGPVALSPMVRRMLDVTDDGAPDFVVVEVMAVAPGVRAEQLRAAVDHLTAIQEPMRYRFRRNNLGWRIDVAEQSGHLLDVVVLPPVSADDEIAMLNEDQRDLVADLDITRGPLLRARFYDRGNDRGGILLFVVHHFVYDEISTVPLLEDLNAALADIAHRGQPDQRVRPAAWRDWSQHLVDSAQSDELAGELTYWTSVLRAGADSGTLPPADRPAEPGMTSGRVSGDRIEAMLTAPGAASREAVMTAVAVAWARWRGTSSAFLSTVGYGVPNVFRPQDRSRSVGWFTNVFPVTLPVADGASVRQSYQSIVDTLRAVPNDGIGYGVLRYVSPATEAVARLRALPEPQVLVEHKVGGVDSIRIGDGPVSIRTTPITAEHRSLLKVMSLVVATAVVDGELEFHIAHDGRFDAGAIAGFATCLSEAFAELNDLGRPE